MSTLHMKDYPQRSIIPTSVYNRTGLNVVTCTIVNKETEEPVPNFAAKTKGSEVFPEKPSQLDMISDP